MKIKYLFLIFLYSVICNGQTYSINSILKDDNYILKDSLHAIINNNKISVYEIIHYENETDRFLLLKFNNKEIYNKNSLLNTSDYQGYTTNYIKKTKNGFVFSIEFGSRYYCNFKFYFNLNNGDFYLNNVSKISFDKYNPKAKKRTNTIMIKKKISFKKFNIHNFVD